jgi:signal transduction histidine kinase
MAPRLATVNEQWRSAESPAQRSYSGQRPRGTVRLSNPSPRSDDFWPQPLGRAENGRVSAAGLHRGSNPQRYRRSSAWGFGLAPSSSAFRADAFAVQALEQIVQGVDGTTSDADNQRLVAETLEDPQLRLAFWRPALGYTDAAGQPLAVGEVRPGRRWTFVGRGEAAVAIDHDRALDEEPGLMATIGSAIRLAREKRSAQAELGRFSERINAARAGERQRMERDLHDSAQQRLIALRIHVDLASDQTDDPSLAENLREVGDEIDDTLAELRSISHGLHPALATHGLAAALRKAVACYGERVRIDSVGVGELSAEVEEAAYLSILEAIQNASKHAGDEAQIRVVTDLTGRGSLRFEVADDGAGFAPWECEAGFGLRSMADRITALGGELEIISSPGAGTTVRGVVPTACGCDVCPDAVAAAVGRRSHGEVPVQVPMPV